MTENILQPTPHRIISIVKHTAQEYTFRVESDTVPDYGQFYMLSLPKVGEAAVSASGRGEGYVEFTVRNTGTVTGALFTLSPGRSLFLRGPYGNGFPVERFYNRELLVICGGTGLSPVMTMLGHFRDNPGLCRGIHLIAGFKNSESVLFREELERFKSCFDVILTLDEGENEGFRHGMVTEHIDCMSIINYAECIAVIVGPPAMMRSTALKCVSRGISEDNIWVSLERRMSCGAGKCGHCKIGGTYVCLDGPVFNYRDAGERLID